MKLHLSLRPLQLAGLATLLGSPAAQAQAPTARPAPAKAGITTVYLVRHAEKDSTSNPADPTLSALGQARAQALRKVLARRHPAALFTTDTKRTRATLAPLAKAIRLEPQVYSPKDNAALASRIRQDYTGQTVVVVGHSNTLLPLITALGGTPPVATIGDKEYDYLFTVRLADGATVTVDEGHYGAGRKGAKAAPAAPMR